MSNSQREKRCLWIHSLIIIPLISVMVAALYFYPVQMDWSWSPTHLPAVLELRASKSGEVIEIPLSQYFPRGHLGGHDNEEDDEEGTSPKARLISSATAESSDGCDLSAVDLQTSQLKSQLDSSINLILVVSNLGCPILRKVENAALAGYFGILIYPSSSSSNDDNDSSLNFDPTSDLNSDMGIDLRLLVAITQDKSVGLSIREKYCHPRRFWATFRPPQNKLIIWYGQFKERSHQLVEELHKLTGNKLRLQGQTLVFLGASLALLLGAIWAAAHFSKSGREARKMRRFKEYERMYRAKCEEDQIDEEEEEEEGQGQSEDELEGRGQGQSQSEEEEQEDDQDDDDDEEEQEQIAENGLDKMKRCREALGLPRKLWIPFSSFDILVAYQQKIREIDPDLDNDNDNDDGHNKSRKSRLTIGQRREMKRLERAMNFLVQNNNAK